MISDDKTKSYNKPFTRSMLLDTMDNVTVANLTYNIIVRKYESVYVSTLFSVRQLYTHAYKILLCILVKDQILRRLHRSDAIVSFLNFITNQFWYQKHVGDIYVWPQKSPQCHPYHLFPGYSGINRWFILFARSFPRSRDNKHAPCMLRLTAEQIGCWN